MSFWFQFYGWEDWFQECVSGDWWQSRNRNWVFFTPNMLGSSSLCLAFLLFAKEENWEQRQHLWAEEKANKAVSGVRGRLHLHQREGMGRDEKKMSEIHQVRRAGTGCVRLGSSCTHLRQERGKCLSHTLGGEEPDTRKGLVAGRGGF